MKDKLFDLYGYTWDEAPKHLKKYALHLSGALKIDKFEAYELLINKCFEKEINLDIVQRLLALEINNDR